MSTRLDRMVFNYVLPTSYENSAVSYGFMNNESYSAQSTPRDIPRTPSRYATVAPADLYTPAIASGQTSAADYSYGSRQITAYPTPPRESGDYYDSRTRGEPTRSSRHSSYDRRPSPPEYEVKTVSTSSTKRYYCEIPDCVDENGRRKSVGRKADLKRHMDTVHGSPTIDCQYPKCWRRGEDGFRREDHYKEHLRGYHNAQIPKADRSRRSS